MIINIIIIPVVSYLMILVQGTVGEHSYLITQTVIAEIVHTACISYSMLQEYQSTQSYQSKLCNMHYHSVYPSHQGTNMPNSYYQVNFQFSVDGWRKSNWYFEHAPFK